MTDVETQAYADAKAAVHAGPAALLEVVADKVGLHAGARAVFGDPVERDGLTIVPVAQMIYGTGAGGGTGADDEAGVGAGGGALTRPIGYIELGPAGATYRPIREAWQYGALAVFFAFASLLVAKAVRTLIRA